VFAVHFVAVICIYCKLFCVFFFVFFSCCVCVCEWAMFLQIKSLIYLFVYCLEVHAARNGPRLRSEARASAAEVSHSHKSEESATSVPESVPCEDNIGKRTLYFCVLAMCSKS